ncbi:MAG: hypothetical protein F9B45_20680 [Phycisphaera sp. RhM]|nr:hypothetical protein [Phycisphaera sp. RhM]
MSETRFDAFLATQLTKWLETRVTAGERYQFRSSDSSNTTRMISQLRASASGFIDVHGTTIPFLEIGGIRLLCVAHSDTPDVTGGFNENYISMLRDRVAEQDEVFQLTSLLIIHNSLLDTLVNSAIDLASSSAPWSPTEVQYSLLQLATAAGNSGNVYKCLLQWQAEVIADEGGSVFGFRRIHDSIAEQQDLDLRPLGLFNDSGLTDMDKPQQIKRRLEDIRVLPWRFT